MQNNLKINFVASNQLLNMYVGGEIIICAFVACVAELAFIDGIKAR